MKNFSLIRTVSIFSICSFAATSVFAQSSQVKAEVSQAVSLIKSGQTEAGANALYRLSKRSDLASDREQLKYTLGLALFQMKLDQVASFQFVDVLRKEKTNYTAQAVEKLMLTADRLGDETLLNYAVSHIKPQNFPQAQADMLYFRMGESYQRERQFQEAISHYSKVAFKSRYFPEAKYGMALSYAEMGNLDLAIQNFDELLKSRMNKDVNDVVRVSAILGLARTYYQKKDWLKSIVYYKMVPKDNENWHEALFEMTWADFMGAKFRSSLSNLQSLHSTYYDDAYLPESLLLRSTAYLYICKFDETEKVLNMFEKSYGPVQNGVKAVLASTKDPIDFFEDILRADDYRTKRMLRQSVRIPYVVARKILDTADVHRELMYYKKLAAEQKLVETRPQGFASSPLGQYSKKLINLRMVNTKKQIGEMVKTHLQETQNELTDFYEQAGFIRFEMISGKKDIAKAKMEGHGLEKIDESLDRKFYVQNGYEYWPFKGEYWLDEIGSYHYLGKSNCGK